MPSDPLLFVKPETSRPARGGWIKECDYCDKVAIVAFRYPNRKTWWFGCEEHEKSAEDQAANVETDGGKMFVGKPSWPANEVRDPERLSFMGDFDLGPYDISPGVPLVHEELLWTDAETERDAI